MTEHRGNYQELTEYSSELFDQSVETSTPGDTPGHTPGLQQTNFSGTEPLLSPPTTYQPSPDLNENPDRTASHFHGLSGSQTPKSSFYENLSSEEYRPAGATPSRPIYNDLPRNEARGYPKQIYLPRRHWLYIVLILLSVYSTLFSGIYLILAFLGPRYGRAVRTGGSLNSAGASLLTQIIAKSIEMSFVTVMVAFVGQVLSRKAFKAKTGQPLGITLAEMNMRVWIMQPGLMVTRWESVRYAVVSVLGIAALLSAIVAMLYTSAADALVKPQLRFDSWRYRGLQGMVNTSFANAQYIEANCQTPVIPALDPEYGTNNCLDVVDFAANSYYNYGRYISNWSNFANSSNGSTDLTTRPEGVGQFNGATDVHAAWIEIANVTEDSETYGRTINNISMAMPHAGVVQAAHDPINGILQPSDLDGLGIYNLKAAVPSPVVNALCVQMTEDELKPLVYSEFPGAILNTSSWPQQLDNLAPGYKFNLTGTKVDQIFNWSNSTGQWPPIFPKYPISYNTVLNQTSQYGREWIYILGKGSPAQGDDYALCGLRAYLTPNCSTYYNVTSSGGNLTANCDVSPGSTDFTYAQLFQNEAAHMPATNASKDFFELVQEWATTLSLQSGITDAQASNARLLTDLMLPEYSSSNTRITLQPKLPSMAEALAVMAGSTLLMSIQDSPFVPQWNYTNNSTITPGVYETFPIALSAQQYASGPSSPYQRVFYPVLLLVFLTNVVILVYLLSHRGLVTDFSEPLNLFALAVNSPPKEAKEVQSSGRWVGPEGRQYETPWFVRAEGEKVYLESGGHDGTQKRRSFFY
ncbi:hypothetical protein EV356DRAFT_498166 [Viridothelium virens]|uniref:Uncharacterized protein n=1 Tax=Viridothelium virens TaxID=1048519 RepID=A0A6A6HFA9_VIRVR|nr:hypothetical protein EV356DRAFT_498166 [Viridothelium virens]